MIFGTHITHHSPLGNSKTLLLPAALSNLTRPGITTFYADRLTLKKTQKIKAPF